MIQIQQRIFIPSLRSLISIRRLKSDIIENIEKDSEINIELDEDLAAKEAEIQLKRNKSRLQTAHFNIMNDRVPYDLDKPQMWFHQTVKYQRKMWGKYGAASGVDPSICWPSKRDLKEIQEFEEVAYPFTVEQMIADAKEKREKRIAEMYRRDADVAAKVAKIDQWKINLKERSEKKLLVAIASKAKKERLIEEVRRHFGFKVSPNDERFQQMIEQREKEQRKKDKEAKRVAKEAQMIARLQQMNIEVSQSAETPKEEKK